MDWSSWRKFTAKFRETDEPNGCQVEESPLLQRSPAKIAVSIVRHGTKTATISLESSLLALVKNGLPRTSSKATQTTGRRWTVSDGTMRT